MERGKRPWHIVVRVLDSEPRCRGFDPHTGRGKKFPINSPSMGRFQLLNLGGLGYEILGSDCNNRFPNTNHNLNHNSNDNLTLNPK